MTALSWETLFFCLATGAALGLLYAVFAGVRALLRAGKVLTAVLDVVFCLLCAAAVFLCALALDKGRLRMTQAVLQLVGGWAAAQVFCPLTVGTVRVLRKISRRAGQILGRPLGIFRGHFRRKRPVAPKKPEKNRKKGKKA